MKKILIIGVLAALAACFPVAVSAQSTGTGFYTQLGFSQPAKGYEILDLGHAGIWNVECTGIASVSSSNAIATLTGNFGGKVWQFKSTMDDIIDANTNWTLLGSLVDSVSVPANTYSNGETQRLVLSNVSARCLWIGYDTTLSSQAFANASGNGTVSASAVPEPSSILALGGMFSSMGMMLRRRKA